MIFDLLLMRQLVLDVSSHDMNQRVESLVVQYRETGLIEHKVNADAIIAEFYDWWNPEECKFDTTEMWA